MRVNLLQPVDAAAHMQRGGVVAYPTEAVYGLGCDPANETAVHHILALKNRPVSAGLILIGADFSQFDGWVGELPGARLKEAVESWPGPNTWLFPPGARAPAWITGEHDSIAIRVTAHETSIALCRAFGGPIVSTSANPRGEEPARSAEQVAAFFGDSIAGIVAGNLGGRDQCSAIRDVRTGRIIRAG